MGGDNYRIGMGGNAVSSLNTAGTSHIPGTECHTTLQS